MKAGGERPSGTAQSTYWSCHDTIKTQILNCSESCRNRRIGIAVRLVLATGPGNPPAVPVRTGNTIWFGSRTVQKPDPLLLGDPNPAPYPSTRRFRRVLLDLSGPISDFAFRVVLFMVALRSLTVNRKILTMVGQCSSWMNWPPLWSKYVDKRSLPHPGNEHQRRVNNFRSCILGNQSGHWLHLLMTEVLAFFVGKSRSDTHPAPLWKWVSNEGQRLKVSHLR